MDGRMSVGARLLACASVLILLAGAVNAFAQGAMGNGTLTGTVVDNVGVVPGATVTATQVDTNVARTATTNEQGEFRIPSLPPGRYTATVVARDAAGNGSRPRAVRFRLALRR